MSTTATTLTTPTRDDRRNRATRPTALPGVLRLGLLRTRYELRAFFRDRMTFIFVFIYPVLMLVIFATAFGTGPGSFGELDLTFPQYFLPGMIATGVMLSSFQNVATSIAVERDEGALKRLYGTPLPPASYFLGKVGQVLVACVLQVALLLVVAAVAFGVPLPTDAGRWATFAWVFVLGAASGAVCGVAFSSVLRSGRGASAVVTPVVLVLQFISGVYFVYSQLPTWMQTAGAVFPLKWLTEAMRSVFLPDSFAQQEVAKSWELPQTALVLAVWAVIGLVLCLRTFRWQRRDAG